jgi:hypothetical protein
LDAATIRGSDEFYERGKSDLLEGVSQAGQIFLSTELTVPHCSDGIIASQLVIHGQHNVSCDYDGDDSGSKVCTGSPSRPSARRQQHNLK